MNLRDDGMIPLSTALMNENNKVTTLHLSGNKIGENGARSLSIAFLSENTRVTTLILFDNNIGDNGVNLYQLH